MMPSVDEMDTIGISPGDTLYIAFYAVQNSATLAALTKLFVDTSWGCLGSNCNKAVRIVALDDTQALLVLLLSLLPGIGETEATTMSMRFGCPVYLEVIIVVKVMESEIALEEPIWPSIPSTGKFFAMAILLSQDDRGSISRWNRVRILNVVYTFFCFRNRSLFN